MKQITKAIIQWRRIDMCIKKSTIIGSIKFFNEIGKKIVNMTPITRANIIVLDSCWSKCIL